MKFICITGYGATGQTALLDLFREFENYKIPPNFEFRLIKDPYGILDLEIFLVENWDMLRANTAIKDFLEFCKVLNRQNNKFFYRGESYSTIIDESFLRYSEEYIDRLSICTYKGRSLTNEYKKKEIDFFTSKVISKIVNRTIYDEMTISQPDYDVFINETQIYLEKIFYKLSHNNTQTIVIDNAIPTSNISKTLKYFKNIKMIIVDRDIRDTYVDLKRKKLLIGIDLHLDESVDKYIQWVKSIRKKSVFGNDKKVIRIQFEDLILDYENTLVKVKKFLGKDIVHGQKFDFLDPQKSKNNIGIWKSYPNQNVMSKILEEVPEYCYTIDD
jgi:hypothetical protein